MEPTPPTGGRHERYSRGVIPIGDDRLRRKSRASATGIQKPCSLSILGRASRGIRGTAAHTVQGSYFNQAIRGKFAYRRSPGCAGAEPSGRASAVNGIDVSRTVAALPAGSRISDYITLGVVAKFFPIEKIPSVPASGNAICQRMSWCVMSSRWRCTCAHPIARSCGAC
jgi:hypothetical protein